MSLQELSEVSLSRKVVVSKPPKKRSKLVQHIVMGLIVGLAYACGYFSATLELF